MSGFEFLFYVTAVAIWLGALYADLVDSLREDAASQTGGRRGAHRVTGGCARGSRGDGNRDEPALLRRDP